MKKILLFLFAAFLSFSLSATHITGGSIRYECVDSAKELYQITLWRYRKTDGLSLPARLYVTVRTYPGGSPATHTLERSAIDTLPVNPCIDPEAIYERHSYVSQNIRLPEGSTVDIYSDAQCCRNINIINLLMPTLSGARFFARIPDPGAYPCNSAPLIEEAPALSFPLGQLFHTRLKATDPDGDSLSFFLAPAFDMGNYEEDSIPPLPLVAYAPGYNFDEPMGAAAGFRIDPVSGSIRATAKVKGDYVVNYGIREYRQNKLIGIYYFEFLHAVRDPLYPEPQALFFADTILSCDSTVRIPENCNRNVFWDFTWPGNKDTSSLSAPQFSYPGPGTYTILYLRHRETGITDSFFFTVLVDSSATSRKHLLLRLPADTTLCAGETLQIDAMAINGIQWIEGEGLSCNDCKSPTLISDSSQTLIAATGMNGCYVTDSFRLTVHPDPGGIISNDTSLCKGDSITLSAGGYIRYRWRPGRSLSDNDSSVTIARPDISTQYTLTAFDNFGCRYQHHIDVMIFPQTGRLWAEPSDRICRGDTVQLRSSGFAAFNWQPGTLLSDSNSSDPLVRPDQKTTFTLHAIDTFGCRQQMQITINVLARPGTIVLNRDSLAGCYREEQSINASASGAQTYRWEPKDWIISSPKNAPSVVIRILGSREFTVTAIGAGACERDTGFAVVRLKNASNTLKGTVRKDSTVLEGVAVSMIAYEERDSSLYEIARTQSNASGSFELRDTGLSFSLRAVPQLNPDMDYILPQYLSSSAFWHNADTLSPDSCSYIKNIRFNLIRGSLQSGPGLIRCRVIGQRGQALFPMIVYLVRNDSIRYASITDSNGYFSIGNLPLQSYRLYGDWPYLENKAAPVIELTAAQPLAINLVAVKTGTELVLKQWNGTGKLPDIAARIFPNPAGHFFGIEWKEQDEEAHYELLDSRGRICRQGRLATGHNYLDIKDINSGFYILRLRAGGRIAFFKVIKD